MTVVVLESSRLEGAAQVFLREADIEVRTQRGSGPGGQHRNKTDSCVIMRHRPTGIEARADLRSQLDSRRAARQVLEARVRAHFEGLDRSRLSQERKSLSGCGARGDKVRTYRVMDDRVTDQRTGRKAPLQKILQGRLDLLWS